MSSVSGYVEHIIYQNSENGYTVLALLSDGEEITCVGNLGGIEEGENIEADGSLVAHPVYGEQFKIASYRRVVPTDADGMERYLASGAVKGIGETLAARIVKYFGADSFRIIEEEPERLSEVKGISERMARHISEQVQSKKEMRDAMVFLQKYGVSNTMAVRIFNKYGAKLYSIMRENPYQLADDITGIGFRTADEIALKIGLAVDSQFRIKSGIVFTLKQASTDGHTYLPLPTLLGECAEILGIAPEHIEAELTNLAMDKKIVLIVKEGETLVYDWFLYYAEQKCARLLLDLATSIPTMKNDEWERVQTRIAAILREQETTPDEWQLQAVEESVRQGVVIISGGPGTGKTTTINSIIAFHAEEKRDILLAAPTGRAAKRMTAASGYEAKTLHRLLEVKSDGDSDHVRFERNEEYPLEADVIIIDEMSMVDIHLFLALLKAVPLGTRLILVGDVNQLPSVGAGQVLKDIIESKAFTTVMLTKIFRQDAESDIVHNAHRINNGVMPILDNKSKDFFFLERNDTDVIYKHMVQLITEKLPPYVNADPMDIQVLTPMRKGPLGVRELNNILRQYLNPPNDQKKEYLSGETLYREGDKVMQIKNNYNLEWEIAGIHNIVIDRGVGVYNGDSGIIREIDERAGYMVVEYDEGRRVTYSLSQLAEIEPAFSITIHKSQGSEYPAVIIPLLSGPRLLFNRNLLYTGVTRARRLVAILGQPSVIADMVANVSPATRNTSLHERIREIKCS